MTTYYLQTLGGLVIREGGPDGEVRVQSSKGLAVLAYLATTPDHSARRTFLATILWPRSERPLALQALRQALYYVGRKTRGDLARSPDGRLTLNEQRLEVDLWRFEEALEAGEYERAVALYGGPFLPGFEVEGGRELEHWIDAQQHRVRAGLEGAFDWLVSERLEREDADGAVDVARRWASVEPASLQALAQLVRSLTAAGDERGAFVAYEDYSALRKQRNGVEYLGGGNRQVEELRELVYGVAASASSF